MTSSTTVRVQDLTKTYGDKLALRSVSLRLQPGITGLLGPNGAGKTTLIRSLATVLKPDSGSIEVNGITYDSMAHVREIRSAIGYMPQGDGLYPTFTVESFISHIAILKGMTSAAERAASVERVLAITGLSDERRQRIRRLSGGMRRRISLAQALLGSPSVILLDEPTAGLDPEQRMRFREYMSVGLEGGACTLLSTHQTEDVAAVCSTVLVLASGTILFEGSPDDLASRAEGRVWLSNNRPDDATLVWQAGSGRYRSIGPRPPEGRPINPTIEDGYLMLLAQAGLTSAEP